MAAEPNGTSHEPNWDALARYLSGESSPSESAEMRQWLAAHPDEAAALMAVESATARLRAAPPVGLDVEAAWKRISGSMAAGSVARVIPIDRRRATWWSSPALRAAAVIAVMVSGVAVAMRMMRSAPESGANVAAARTITTPAGTRDSVRLDDGSRILLGPGSVLRIAEGYGTRQRDVTLEGEALFDVTHDGAHPFVVHTGNAVIQDIGTTFTVRAPQYGDRATTVAVTSGVVRVTHAGAVQDTGLVLRQGDVATAGEKVVALDRRGAVAEAMAWTTGSLVFRDTPLRTVAATLRRWYGIRVIITDSALADTTYTGSFDFSRDSLGTILNSIHLVLDKPVQRRDSVVVIGRGTVPPNSP